ncbi:MULTISPECIES: group III truncated hemoglobin [Kitasatospora]|uniref:group III truncated hemoglobin n=1 Tax=Kitasatospora TaxID=2063 RepID=UPI000C7077F3|nr:group III truncated hemoglobin [Kitasatospora sp. GP30]MDH6144993.1 hemoglobin [Kitasatospora sp. GP30]
MRTDIATRGDLELLLRRFYAAAFADPLIGRHFGGMDLEAHLPRITDFWASSLLRTGEYRGNLFAPHASLPLTAEHYGRWVQLWSATVDGRHQGPVAERAKERAQRIAVNLIRRTSGEDPATGGPGGFVPLSALLLRSA